MKTVHYIVKGMVQGVFFRHHTRLTAQQLNICGTVKNLYNGDVEVLAQGEPAALEEFEIFLHQGPISARVDQVIRQEIEDDTVYSGFNVVY